MSVYKHTVQYYETDKMGVAHHSNYIRWMEEARVAFLSGIGWDYAKLEETGFISPVTAVSGRYKNSCTFSDEVLIRVSVEECRGVRLRIGYVMEKADGTRLFEGSSEHCFLDHTGRPVRLEKTLPAFYRALKDHAGEEAAP